MVLKILIMALFSLFYGFIGMIVLVTLYYFIAKYILGKRIPGDKEDSPNRPVLGVIIYILCVLVIFFYLGIKSFWGNDIIGSPFSKQNFTTQYYVNLFPSRDSSKNYRVPADIEVINYDDIHAIQLRTVYWPNGGHTDFPSDDYDINNLKFYEKIFIEDSENREWFVELTKYKVKK